MNQAKQEYRKVLAFRAAMNALTTRQIKNAHRQHKQLLRETDKRKEGTA